MFSLIPQEVILVVAVGKQVIRSMPYKDVFFLSKCSVKPVLTFFPLDPQPHHPLNKMMPSKHTDCFAGWSGERLWTLWDGL